MPVRCEVDSNRTDDWFTIISPNDFLWDCKRNRERLGSLFIAGAIAVIVGLLFPLRGRILDVLLIFSLSLTVAVMLITFSARAALQVMGKAEARQVPGAKVAIATGFGGHFWSDATIVSSSAYLD